LVGGMMLLDEDDGAVQGVKDWFRAIDDMQW